MRGGRSEDANWKSRTSRLIFGDLLAPATIPHRPYQEIDTMPTLIAAAEKALMMYNEMGKSTMQLVIFIYAAQHTQLPLRMVQT